MNPTKHLATDNPGKVSGKSNKERLVMAWESLSEPSRRLIKAPHIQPDAKNLNIAGISSPFPLQDATGITPHKPKQDMMWYDKTQGEA